MADWAKIKFFWKTMTCSPSSALTASSAAEGHGAEHVFNMTETGMWMAAGTTGPHYLSYDAGSGHAESADYIALSGHNLFSSGSPIVLQYSDDGLEYSDAFAPFTPASDKAFAREFSDPGPRRYWRVRIEAGAEPPFICICVWGKKTELDYATASFDPNEQEAKASVNLAYGGYLAGVHEQYTERTMTLKFEDAGQELYQKISEWWEGSGLRNFFIAWESSDHPDEVFLMRPDTRFSNPLKAGGRYRDITINLSGRKEK